jgi:hypothetical protein
VILKDDKLNTPNPKAVAVSALVNASADSAFGLSKLIDLSDHKAWYSIKTNYYVNKELLLGLKPKQEGLAASTPVHDHGHSRYHSPRPLGYVTGSASMMMIETFNAY